MLLFGLCVYEAISKVHFSQPFSLLSELHFSNLAVPEAIFQFFHGKINRILYVCMHRESYYVAIVLDFSLLHVNQLKICMYPVIPQGWRVTLRARARAARVKVMAMRVAGDKEGEGGKGMAMATRVAVKWMATMTKRALVTKTRLGCNNQSLSRGAMVGSAWQQEHPRAALDDWRQKWPATRALTITQQWDMDKVRGNRSKQQPTINGNSNSGWWLALIPSEGSG